MTLLLSGIVCLVMSSCSTAPEAPRSITAAGELAVTAVHSGVQYYGACGNETLVYQDTTYYPLPHDELSAIDLTAHRSLLIKDSVTTTAPEGATDQASTIRHAVAMIPAPGPGDDVGTLTVFDDHLAHFVSDSGTEYWLTTQFRSNNWVC